jgi:predicted nuclease with TOPRIM domain
MGSRVSTNNNSNGELQTQSSSTKSARGKTALVELQRELLERDEILSKKDTELNKLREELAKRDEEIIKLQKRIHELDCVVQQTSSNSKIKELPKILEEKPAPLFRSNSTKWKRQAVSGESSSNIRRQESNRELLKFSKDSRYVYYKHCSLCDLSMRCKLEIFLRDTFREFH